MNSGPLDARNVSVIYDATGLLLILGEPGSGKTTTLLDLARTLLERARDDIKERVAIVLNLSSWKKKQPLAEWIAMELSEKYRVPRKIARFWLQHGYLLPPLDGLDEIQTSMQPDCVAAINSFIEEFDPPGLVVCCRLNEYRWLPERLKLSGAICLEPLSSGEVSKYLAAGGSNLAALRAAIDADAVLQELAQTPLMLSIMSLACQGPVGNELARQKGDSPEERRNQIFGLYVEQMFQRKGTAPLVFRKEKIISWLSWLARKMRQHSQSVFLVEGLQPGWLSTRAQRVAYGTVVVLSLGLISWLIVGLNWGLIFGLLGGLNVGLRAGLIVGLSILFGVGLGCWSESPSKNGIMSGSIGGLMYGLFVGLTSGLLGGLGVGSLNRIAPVETISWNWNKFWKRTISGLRPGLIGGQLVGLVGMLKGMIEGLSAILINGLSVRLLVGLSVGPIFGLIVVLPIFGLLFGLCGLMVGLLGGVISGVVGGPTYTVKAGKVSPNQGIKLSLKNALVVSWSGALTWGFGLIFGLHRGGSAVIKHYALRLILWRSGYIPLNFNQFPRPMLQADSVEESWR